MTNSNYIDLSKLSYIVDDVAIKNMQISDDIYAKIHNELEKNLQFNESGVEFLDYFHDLNGVSGSAFKDKKTGEIIISFTGTNEVGDWGNNIAGAGLGLYDYCKPAYEFYEKIQNKYGEEITLTGHSQGGGIAQRVAIEYNVQKTIVVNPAPLYTGVVLSKPHLLVSMNNIINIESKILKFDGKVLRLRSKWDVLNLIAQPIAGRYLGDEYHLEEAGWHMLDDIKNSSVAMEKVNSVVDAYFSESLKGDFNLDGYTDIQEHLTKLSPKNLLSDDVRNIVGSEKITVKPEILRYLASNLSNRLSIELAEMLKLCQLCISKNESIAKDFSNRKTQISESIKTVFKETGLASLLFDLYDSVGKIIESKNILEIGSDYGELKNPFSHRQRALVHQIDLNYTIYNTELATFRRSCEELLDVVNRDKTQGWSIFGGGQPTLLKSWEFIESETKKLLEESKNLFEGEGLRSGMLDGVSQSLSKVLPIILKNTQEIGATLSNAIELILGIATNFENADYWLGQQLSNGQHIGSVNVPILPASYKAYLERDGIFDDVKGVLQAFDRQVEIRSREYAQKSALVYSNSLGNLEQGLNSWLDREGNLRKYLSAVEYNFSQGVYVEESRDPDWDSEKRIYIDKPPITRYWGTLGNLYPEHVKQSIRQIKDIIIPASDRIQQAIYKSQNVKSQLQNLEPQLRPLVEEGVYKAFDLDEIVYAQQSISSIANRLSNEINHVINVVVGEGMTAQSIKSLQAHLLDSKQRLDYYTQFINDCFGDNGNSGYVAPSGGGNKNITFNLN